MVEFRKVFKLSLSEYFLLFKICLMGFFFSSLIYILPFRKLHNSLGKKGKLLTFDLTEHDISELKQVNLAFRRVKKYFPIPIKCLASALTAKKILKKKGYKSIIHIGLSRQTQKNIAAHAWLSCGDIIITGIEEKKKFKELVFFSSI